MCVLRSGCAPHATRSPAGPPIALSCHHVCVMRKKEILQSDIGSLIYQFQDGLQANPCRQLLSVSKPLSQRSSQFFPAINTKPAGDTYEDQVRSGKIELDSLKTYAKIGLTS